MQWLSDSRAIYSVACIIDKSVLSDRHSPLLVIYYLDIHLANIIPEYNNFGERFTFRSLVLSLPDFSVSVRLCISSIRVITINCVFLVNCFIISKQEQRAELRVVVDLVSANFHSANFLWSLAIATYGKGLGCDWLVPQCTLLMRMEWNSCANLGTRSNV
jgi:hypothetical protein